MIGGDRFMNQIQARFIIALICLFAFTFQTYVVETHIHAAGESRVSSEAPTGHQTPVDKDAPDNCPICQAYALAGTFVTPAIIVYGIAIAWVKAPSTSLPSELVSPFLSRNWRSRAPPQQ
jgi:hypothetical protein